MKDVWHLNRILVQIVTLELILISDPVFGDFAQIVSGLRRPKKSEKWHPYVDDLGGDKHAKKHRKDTDFVRKCMTRLVRKWLPTL